ncbi:MAG: hypothetical protein KKA16_02380 [Alphaproteobacteria bacterium]|nr:hypothetical protein [Alphaproteobacteria bacterium]MBU2377696.1 hypothetical protein [Alphaproteobacteria bacterium]
MPDTTRSNPEADLAFLRSVISGGGPHPHMGMGVAYLAGGLLYGFECLFHVGQILGWIRWSALPSLIFVAAITVVMIAVLVWVARMDRQFAKPGPIVARTMNAAFTATGMVNLAVIIIFGVGSARDQDFAVWLYYPAMVFALQAAAWWVAWCLRRKVWMLATAIGGWATAVALGVLVREPLAYLAVCTAALFGLFAAPGWIMLRASLEARRIA